MHRYEVNLHGLSLDEAEAKVRDMIDAAQQEDLELYELALRNIGADLAEHVRLREAAIANMRALVGRGGQGLQ